VSVAPVFDVAAFFGAVDAERERRSLGWYDVAGELWEQSEQTPENRHYSPVGA
jgi:hypothetical protein